MKAYTGVPLNFVHILTGANVALQVLQARIIVIMALILTAGIFAWAMWLQTVLGVIIAATWGAMVFLPVLFAGGRGASDVQETPQHPAPES